jgi:pyruvate formate lyase activating enzyme
LKNLIHIGNSLQSSGHPKEIWIRTPIIPDATLTEDNIRGIGKFIAANLNGLVKRWELCAFNNLCKDKYSRLDIFLGIQGLRTDR